MSEQNMEESYVTLSIHGSLRIPPGISRVRAETHFNPGDDPGTELNYSLDASGANEEEARERIREFRAQLADVIRGKAT